MRVLILGGLGFIGSHTSSVLKTLGHSVGVMDCFNQYNYIPDAEYAEVLSQRVSYARADHIFEGRIEDRSRLDEVFSQFRPQTVIHLATYPNAKMVDQDRADAFRNMVSGTSGILEACNSCHVERLVFASSSMVYGDFDARIPDERSPTLPATLYGKFKLQGEQLCQQMGQKFGLEVVVLRPSALYGPRDIIVRVISLMTNSCLQSGKIIVQGKESRLDFSFVEDVAEAFALAALHPKAAGQVFNCTRGRGRTILEAAEILRASLGHGSVELRDADAFYPSRGTLNSDKIKAELGWEPHVDIESGIPAYLKWFLAQGYVNRGSTVR